MALKFSIPYNQDFTLLEKLDALKVKNKIVEMYFSGPINVFGSGRVMKDLNLKSTGRLIEWCRERGIEANLLFNSTCEGTEWYEALHVSQVIAFVKKLNKEYGLKRITIANPLFIQKIKKELPNIQITASVLAFCDSVQRAWFFKKLGADVITPDRDINRNLELLKKIKEDVGVELKLLVNEGCLFKCPYRLFHFNLISHWSKKGSMPTDRFFFNCHAIFEIDPSQILKSCWIRPEDLKKYKKITSFFKISGRTKPTSWILNVIQAYLEENYRGDLLELMDSNLSEIKSRYHVRIDNKKLNGFFEKVTTCSKNCLECNYCNELAKKVIEKEM